MLAPLNSAITKLPHKPWEDREDYNKLGTEAYTGSDGEDRAYTNLKRFVEAHVVPVNKWKEGQKVETVGGSTVWWEQKDGKKLVRATHGSEKMEPADDLDLTGRYRGLQCCAEGPAWRSLGPSRLSELQRMRFSTGCIDFYHVLWAV